MELIKIPSAEEIWNKQEKRIIKVLLIALKLLKEEPSLPNDEDSITYMLFLRIIKVNHDLLKSRKGGLTNIPICQAPNQPASLIDLNEEYIKKKPDIQWGFYNPSEEEYEKATKYYTIECKRLGYPSSSSWIFNRNYVTEGIMRFIKKEFSYGRFTSSGVMIGYVQSMQLHDILNEVNDYLQCKSLQHIALSPDGWQPKDVSRLNQRLNRIEVLPNSFDLRHLWIDLNHIYKIAPPKSQTHKQRNLVL